MRHQLTAGVWRRGNEQILEAEKLRIARRVSERPGQYDTRFRGAEGGIEAKKKNLRNGQQCRKNFLRKCGG